MSQLFQAPVGTRAVFMVDGEPRAIFVQFFAVLRAEPLLVAPLVPNHHEYPTHLVQASELGSYALLFPGEEVSSSWFDGIGRGQ